MKSLLRRAARPLLFALGVLCIALGVLGAFLPLLPSTVFFIVAAWAFARSHPPFQLRLLEHPLLGPPLRDWGAGRGLSARAKVLAVLSITLTFTVTIGFVVEPLWLRVALGVLAAVLITYLLRRPTRKALERG